ncbi:MAG: flavodoxin domain-containing protein [Sphaerochaeta sp.]|uniref:flavodoxin domain-containing protein n=2 Tax=Sphaerochaeta TaxID=399320 RepID=UPI0018EA2DD7|nr:flavodoxin domain-containing protein [Sphaerochaeta sp. S2]MBJ2357476.1 MBL fold metallo-hydrolase [Sphaerochaeta sp. S2]MCK9347864.1 MBL fold metallo-hydrolase [Sphaerochaeta sp.]MDD4302406.1 MBL fold metallo-hydrolase [Sphaerochaeta sp.]MDY0244857.1 MBL fold metallo-hydrolase [Sphaerochaeta sp.]
MKRLVKNNVSWIGKIDWELQKFHGDDYSVNHGSSQNAYLIEEEKTVLIDTIWKPYDKQFRENLEKEINLEKLDFIVVNHGEVDHSGALPYLMEKVPNLPIYCTANAVKSLVGQYHHPEWNYQVVKTGDSLDIGNGKQLVFVEMRMLHWPDSMATYLTGDNILFSNDAFGQHYAVEELFNDKADQCLLWTEAMKYYANILNPFSPLVKRKIEEIVALNLPIDIIAPSHGAIWRDNPMQIVNAYAAWADSYQENQITIVYDTMWDGTKQLAHALAGEIQALDGDTVVKVFSISQTDKNDIMTEVFKSKAIALGSPTVGKSILSSVGGWLHFLSELQFKKKSAAVFGCYGWSGEGVGILREELSKAGFSVVEPEMKVNWNPTEEHLSGMRDIAEALCR